MRETEKLSHTGHWTPKGAPSITACGFLIIALVASCSTGSAHGHSSPSPSTAGDTRPTPTPLASAIHDAHGLIVKLPTITAILGRTPIPGLTLKDDIPINETIGKSTVTSEASFGSIRTSSQYRFLTIDLMRWPRPESIGNSLGRVGPGPYHQSAHNWIGGATSITGLGDSAIIYQTDDDSGTARVADKTITFDSLGAHLDARYKNVTITATLDGANIQTSKDGRINVTYESYEDTRKLLTKFVREIIEHL